MNTDKAHATAPQPTNPTTSEPKKQKALDFEQKRARLCRKLEDLVQGFYEFGVAIHDFQADSQPDVYKKL